MDIGLENLMQFFFAFLPQETRYKQRQTSVLEQARLKTCSLSLLHTNCCYHAEKLMVFLLWELIQQEEDRWGKEKGRKKRKKRSKKGKRAPGKVQIILTVRKKLFWNTEIYKKQKCYKSLEVTVNRKSAIFQRLCQQEGKQK